MSALLYNSYNSKRLHKKQYDISNPPTKSELAVQFPCDKIYELKTENRQSAIEFIFFWLEDVKEISDKDLYEAFVDEVKSCHPDLAQEAETQKPHLFRWD
ncbi:MAG: hypothetical protein K5793_05465 [Nitrosarchaeum sp.]|nr:hypothetical protein [Nitrosarchaeum sp.]